jgi:thiamine biosynthesis protein ThiS
MNIVVNGENRTVTSELTVAGLVSQMGLAGKRLAVEVNREIVPRSQHDRRILQPDDRIEVVVAIGGG